MITVYRIEHKVYGFGPLCAQLDDLPRWEVYFRDHMVPSDDPSFEDLHDDLTEGERREYFFGCLDVGFLDGIMRDGAPAAMDGYGFHLCSYEVDRDYLILCDDAQVYFKKSSAMLVESIPVSRYKEWMEPEMTI